MKNRFTFCLNEFDRYSDFLMTKTNSPAQQLPPGPNTSSLRNVIQWATDPITFLEKSTTQYGDLFSLKLYQGKTYVFTSNPEVIQEILSKDINNFDAGRGNQALLPLVGQYSTLLIDGKLHSRQRKLNFPPFHGEKIRGYGKKMAEITEEVAKPWEDGKAFSLRSSMQEITLEVIMQTVFGISDFERKAQLKDRLVNTLELVLSSVLRSTLLFFPILQQDFPGSPWRTFLKNKRVINELLQAEIEERRNSSEKDDNNILSLLMLAEDEDGNSMSDEELQDQLMTLLVAGHETTATALTWAFYWLHYFPEMRDKLLAELETISDPSDIKTLNQLPYLDAVCKETLRIYPVTIITSPRITKTTTKIGDYEYPPETFLAPSMYLLHQREDLYPNPKQFQPERFLEKKFNQYEFMPFGGGNRRCIGDAFAPMEIKVVLATVLKKYPLALTEKTVTTPARRGITLAPNQTIKMKVTS